MWIKVLLEQTLLISRKYEIHKKLFTFERKTHPAKKTTYQCVINILQEMQPIS